MSIRKLNFSYNNLTVLPGEICFLTLSLELDLNFNPQLKYPFREWYLKGTPFLIDNIKPYCSGTSLNVRCVTSLCAPVLRSDALHSLSSHELCQASRAQQHVRW